MGALYEYLGEQDDAGATPLHRIILFPPQAKMLEWLEWMNLLATRQDLIKKFLFRRPSIINVTDHNDQTPLHWVINNITFDENRPYEYYITAITELLKYGADCNAKDKNGNTPLHLAAQGGKLTMVEYLIDSGANKENCNNLGYTPLHLAVICNQRAAAIKLKEKGASLNATDKNGNTPLHVAIEKGCLDLVKYLVQSGASLHHKNKTGLTPIDVASTTGHLDYIPQIFAIRVRGIDINATGSDGLTHLQRTIQREDLQLAKLLIELGAIVRPTDRGISTLLHLAVQTGDLDLAKQLVEQGADMYARDKQGLTPLHAIALSATPHINLAIWLVKRGTDINLVDHQGNTALHLALKKGHTELAGQLLALGADPYSRNKAGLTPSHIAFQASQLAWIRQLIQQPGLLPLHWAIRADDIELVKQLVALEVDLNETDQTGWTGLHVAADQGNLTMLKYLIEKAKMLPFMFDKQGKTALDIALEKNHKEVIAYLRKLATNDFQEHRAEVQAQMVHQFENELQEPLRQMWSHLGIDPHAINTETLATEWLNNMQAMLEGAAYIVPTASAEEHADLQAQVDEFLEGIQEGLKENEAAIPEVYKEAFLNFSVESLRPYATELVKACEELQQTTEKFEQAQREKEKSEERLVGRQPQTQEEPTQKGPESTERSRQPGKLLTTENRWVSSTYNLFVANYRISNIEDIKEYLEYIQKEISKLYTNQRLTEEQETDIKSILSQIRNEQQELKPLYRALKAHVNHRGADMLTLEQDTSELDEIQKEKFEQEARIIQEAIEDVELARKFLIELQEMKEEVCQILKERNENLADYEGDNYDSDFENDYSKEELAAYLTTCGLDAPHIQHKKFLTAFRNKFVTVLKSALEELIPQVSIPAENLHKLFRKAHQQTKQAQNKGLVKEKKLLTTLRNHFVATLQEVLKELAPEVSMDVKVVKKLFRKAYKQTQKTSKETHQKEQEFIATLRHDLSVTSDIIIKKLGSQEALIPQDLIALLQEAPPFMQHVQTYYPDIAMMPSNNQCFAHIHGLVLHAILTATTIPIGSTIQLKQLNELKKRIHRLNIAIKQVMVQQAKESVPHSTID